MNGSKGSVQAGYQYHGAGQGMYPSAGQSQPQQVVLHMDNPPAGYRWSWCHLITAVIGNFWCQPLGLISLVMSLLAYTDHKSKDYNRARSKRSTALGLAIAAIVFGVVFTIIAVVAIINTINARQPYDPYEYNGK